MRCVRQQAHFWDAVALSSCACKVWAPRLESFLWWLRAWMETSWRSAATVPAFV
jgi:hypothetical protein